LPHLRRASASILIPGIFATNRSEEALVLWRDYNQRAIIEQRIAELKAELNAEGFCMKQFFATEAAFLSVLFVFNPLSLYQKALNPHAPCPQQATLRSAVFLGGPPWCVSDASQCCTFHRPGAVLRNIIPSWRPF